MRRWETDEPVTLERLNEMVGRIAELTGAVYGLSLIVAVLACAVAALVLRAIT